MSQQFDPYRIWFGIPPQHQPPNHYRLLGIELFESDAEVITHAADQRMVHLKTFAAGKHSALSQKLLNEVAAARVCLLNPAERAKYDAALRARLTRQAAVRPALEGELPGFDPLSESLYRPHVNKQGGRKKNRSASNWAGLALAGVAMAILAVVVLLLLPKGSSSRVAAGNDSGAETEGARAGGETAAPRDREGDRKKPVPDDSQQVTPPAELPKADPPKADPPKTDPPKADPPKTDPPKTDPPKTDPPKTDPPKADPPKADPPKTDPPKTDPPKTKDAVIEVDSGDSSKGEPPTDVRPSDDPFATSVSENPPRVPSDRPRPEIKLKDPPFSPANPLPDVSPPDNPSAPPETPQSPPSNRKATLPPVAQEQPKRASVPDEDALKAAEKEIRDLFKDAIRDAIKPEQKSALAAKLSRMAIESKDKPSQFYALLRMSVAYYAEGNSVELAFPLIDQMASAFEVNPVELKASALAKAELGAVKAGPQASQQLLAIARKLTEDALSAGEIDAAAQSLKVAQSAAQHLKDVATRKQIQDTIKEIDRLKVQATAAKKAAETLKVDPADPAANGDAGRWNCFVCNDWKSGLPQLARCDDETLRDLAKLDLSSPSDTPGQLSVADGWLQQCGGKKGFELLRIQEHAASWYRQVLPKLSGLDRVKVEQKLDKAGIRVASHALKFDGSKSYVVVKNFAYPSNQPITIEAIVKFEGDTHYSMQTIFGTGSYPGFFCARSGNYITYDFCSHDSSTTLMEKYVSPRSGIWNHVAIETDGAKKRLFLNGQEIRARSASGPYQQSPNPLLLGAQPSRGSSTRPATPSQFLCGEIRGLRISNAARYNADFTPPSDLTADGSTVLLFQFSEGKGNFLKDCSGRSKLQGEIVDAQWVRVDDLTVGGDGKAAGEREPGRGRP